MPRSPTEKDAPDRHRELRELSEDERHQVLVPLKEGVDERLERYVRRLVAAGRSVDDVGGVDGVIAAIEASLPAVNRLAERAGPVFTVEQVRRLLVGVHNEPLDPQAVYNRARKRQLVGAKTADGQWVFPEFGFTRRPGRLQVREDVLDLWRLLPEPSKTRFDAWTLIGWLGGPRADLGGGTPLEWLDTNGLDALLQRATGQVRRRAAA